MSSSTNAPAVAASVPATTTGNTTGNKRSRGESANQEPTASTAGVMPNYMGYFPPGTAPVSQSVYQQMPPSSDGTVMALPPLYVGPATTTASAPGEANADGTPAKKKHTSQWALEKRRARNRVTAAESRRKSKLEQQSLKDEVARLSNELKTKNDLLGEYKEKFEMYENGQSKAEVERVISQRRAALAAAAAVAQAADIATATSSSVQVNRSGDVSSRAADIPVDGEVTSL